MKNKQIIAVGIMLMLPLALQAQENIKKAFDALINDNSADVSTTHKLNRDPQTGTKEGQLDVYEFTIPMAQKQLVKNIERAFEKDQDQAYSINSGSPGKSGYAYESVAVGGSSSYMLGSIKGSRYIYAAFIDPQDNEKNHRYLYAMEWKEGQSEIQGKLVVTYATTAQYRSKGFNVDDVMERAEHLRKRAEEIKKRYGSTVTVELIDDAHIWLSKFQSFKKWFLEAKGERKNTQALNIYELCKEVSPLNAEEKKMIIDEIENLKKKTDDELTLKMFDMSIDQLKK